jgi:hypothetical protein
MRALVRIVNPKDQYGSMKDVTEDSDWYPSVSQSKEVQRRRSSNNRSRDCDRLD